MLDHAIVIATRNRPDALRISLPIFLAQNRKAKRVVVVDKSDDHGAIAALCASISPDITVVASRHANSAHQRNLGLAQVEEAVVMFPDDDAFWRNDTAEKMMSVYERDHPGLIGGVTATETHVSPLDIATTAPVKQTRLAERPLVQRLRNRFEDRFFPEPFHVYGRQRIAALAPPARNAGLGFPFVETMGGFRMSFRTELARTLGFDEALGARVGYSQHEDKDLSLRVLKAGKLLAAAPDALVFHNVHPGRRANGFAYGFCHVLNYAYISLKVFGRESEAIARLRPYCSYKTFLYGLRKTSEHDRDIALGARAAMAEFDQLARARPEALAEVYAAISERRLA